MLAQQELDDQLYQGSGGSGNSDAEMEGPPVEEIMDASGNILTYRYCSSERRKVTSAVTTDTPADSTGMDLDEGQEDESAPRHPDRNNLLLSAVMDRDGRSIH